MFDTFYKITSKENLANLLDELYADGFRFWDGRELNAETVISCFKGTYHGNSKMIVNTFYNTITNKKEISVGTMTVYKSYPQFRNLKTSNLIIK